MPVMPVYSLFRENTLLENY